MIRTVVENLLLFLLPTFIYIAWTLFQRAKAEREAPKDTDGQPITTVLDDAPLLWLFASGLILVMLTLAVFGSSSGGGPGQQYQPSVFQDGKIKPSHID
jgi:hypothetical protein